MLRGRVLNRKLLHVHRHNHPDRKLPDPDRSLPKGANQHQKAYDYAAAVGQQESEAGGEFLRVMIPHVQSVQKERAVDENRSEH